MSTVTVTLKTLHTEGRLSLGDILTHEVTGDHELVNVMIDGAMVVKHVETGELKRWEIPHGGKVVPAPRGVE